MTTNTSIAASGTGISQQLLDTMNGTTGKGTTTASAAKGADSGKDLQNTFLKLLVTQMQNQDPTNPMDSSQMTSQLAQINTVTGVGQLNTTLTSLASQMSAGQNAQAAQLIGTSVLAPASSFDIAKGVPPALGVSLPAAATDVNITIKDAAGAVVNTAELGPKPAGNTTFSWDGKDAAGKPVADGTYSISATATVNGAAGTATPLAAGKVQSVIQQPDGSAGLALSNGATVSLSSVASIQ